MDEYTCVYLATTPCPVKVAYKLVPESLVEFCKICNINPLMTKETPNLVLVTNSLVELVDRMSERQEKRDMTFIQAFAQVLSNFKTTMAEATTRS